VPASVIGTAGNGQVSLTWAAPSSNGGSPITDYTIQYSSNGGSSWTAFPRSASTATAATVTGLSNGTSYVFQVAAVNSVGTGGWSSSSAAVTPRTIPAVPSNIIAVIGNSQVSLSWTEPSGNGGSPITDYAIQYSSDGGSSWSSFSRSASPAISATVTGLANGTSYLFRIAAVNVAGTGGWSTNSAAVVPLTVPAVPTSVIGSADNGQVSLSWTAPANNGGSAITDYTIQYSSNGGSSWSTFPRSASIATAATVTGLSNGTSYLFQVAAVNIVGAGSRSSSSSAVTPRTVPAVPTSVVGAADSRQVSLSWTEPSSNGGSPITDYTIQYSSNGGSNWTTFPHSASTATTATVRSLTNGTSYLFKVAAVNAAGAGNWSANSDAVMPLAVPTVPTSVIGTAGNGQVSLSWAAPSSNGGSPITDYTVAYSSNGRVWTAYSRSPSSATAATVTGLTNGTRYVFRVAAVNVADAGSWSISSSAVTPRTVPVVPTSVVGTAGNGLVSRRWTAPSANGGSAITDYTIQYSSNGGSSWTAFSRAASTATAATVTGLTNGTSYLFRVAAVNVAGTGSWSGNSSAVTPRR
jgi:titin